MNHPNIGHLSPEELAQYAMALRVERTRLHKELSFLDARSSLVLERVRMNDLARTRASIGGEDG